MATRLYVMCWCGWRASQPVWMGREVLRLPAVPVLVPFFMPAIRRLAAISHADEARVRVSIEGLPAVRAGSTPPRSRLGRADPVRSAAPQLSDGSDGMVAISR